MNQENFDRFLFNSIADQYALKDKTESSRLARDYWTGALLKLFLSQKKSLGTVIEIGCGIGAPAQYYLGNYDKYIGIDQSSALVQKAKDFNSDNPNAGFMCVNVKELAHQTNLLESADTVLSIGALHHMTELDEVIEVLKKIVKPGAFFLISEPCKSNFLLQWLRYARTLMDKNYSKDQNFFSENELTGLLSNHGLEVVKVAHQGFFSAPLAQVIIKPWFIGVPLSKLAVRLDKFLDKRGTNILKKLGWNINIIARF